MKVKSSRNNDEPHDNKGIKARKKISDLSNPNHKKDFFKLLKTAVLGPKVDGKT